jgi:transcriptional regulator with XRE-family HTH domain
MNSCGDFLKRCREAQNLSQKDVSTHLGYNTSQFISNWERGLSQPPIPTIRTLAKLYKIEADVLFNVILETQVELVRKSLRQKFIEDHSKSSLAIKEKEKRPRASL